MATLGIKFSSWGLIAAAAVEICLLSDFPDLSLYSCHVWPLKAMLSIVGSLWLHRDFLNFLEPVSPPAFSLQPQGSVCVLGAILSSQASSLTLCISPHLPLAQSLKAASVRSKASLGISWVCTQRHTCTVFRIPESKSEFFKPHFWRGHLSLSGFST